MPDVWSGNMPKLSLEELMKCWETWMSMNIWMITLNQIRAELNRIKNLCQWCTSVKLKSSPPWLSHDMLKGIRSWNSSYRPARKTEKAEHLVCYKRKRNRVANMIKAAKSNFFDQLDPSTPKVFWKTTKYFIYQTTIPVLKDANGLSVTCR